MTEKELKKLIKTLRANGVMKYKTADCELELSPDAIVIETKSKKQIDVATENIPTEDGYSEEEALFWSSAGIPEEKVTQ